MSDIEFVGGRRTYTPGENAPDYIVANTEIDRDEHITWLQKQPPKIRTVTKRSKGGKLYESVDTYQRANASEQRQPAPKPQPAPQAADFAEDEIPF